MNTGPEKCTYLLLPRLFYGISIDETENEKDFSCKMIVNYSHCFAVEHQISPIQAKNAVSRKVLQKLCTIENIFVQQQRFDQFPAEFSKSVQE